MCSPRANAISSSFVSFNSVLYYVQKVDSPGYEMNIIVTHETDLKGCINTYLVLSLSLPVHVCKTIVINYPYYIMIKLN